MLEPEIRGDTGRTGDEEEEEEDGVALPCLGEVGVAVPAAVVLLAVAALGDDRGEVRGDARLSAPRAGGCSTTKSPDARPTHTCSPTARIV